MGIQHTRIFTSVFGFLTAQLNTGQNKKKPTTRTTTACYNSIIFFMKDVML